MKSIKNVEKFEKEGFIAVNRPDLSAYKMTLPFNWNANPFNDENWSFQIQTLRYLMVYKQAYKDTLDHKYVVKILEWFNDWWKSSKISTNDYTWSDMATGIRSEKIFEVVDLLKKSKTKTPLWLNEMILEHVRILRMKDFIRTNHNHGLYAVHGLRCLAELVGPGMKKNLIKRSYELITTIIKNQFDDNYVHSEHSPHYHHLTLKSLEDYKKTGFYNDLNILDKYITGAQEISKYLYLPDGREVPFGDTDNKILKSSFDGQNEELRSSFLCKSGYVLYYEGLTYLCLINNYNSTIHKHWDNLSFIFGFQGQDIFVDPGKYKYTKNDIRRKILLPEAHNTISIKQTSWNGKNIIKDSLKTDGKIENNCVLIDASIGLKLENSELYIDRSIKYSNGELSIKDKLSTSIQDDIYSNFVLHKDAKILESCSDKIIINIKDLIIELKISAFNLDNQSSSINYYIDKTPVSYEYGSYIESSTIRIKNTGELNLIITIQNSKLLNNKINEVINIESILNKDNINDNLEKVNYCNSKSKKISEEIVQFLNDKEGYKKLVEFLSHNKLNKKFAVNTSLGIYTLDSTIVSRRHIFIRFLGEDGFEVFLVQYLNSITGGFSFSDQSIFVFNKRKLDSSEWIKIFKDIIFKDISLSKKYFSNNNKSFSGFIINTENRPSHFFYEMLCPFSNETLRKKVSLASNHYYWTGCDFYDIREITGGNAKFNVLDWEVLSYNSMKENTLVMEPFFGFFRSMNSKYKEIDKILCNKKSISYNNDRPIIWFSILSEEKNWKEQNQVIVSIIKKLLNLNYNPFIYFDGLTKTITENSYQKRNSIEIILEQVGKDFDYIDMDGFLAKEKIDIACKINIFLTSGGTDSLYPSRIAQKAGVIHNSPSISFFGKNYYSDNTISSDPKYSTSLPGQDSIREEKRSYTIDAKYIEQLFWECWNRNLTSKYTQINLELENYSRIEKMNNIIIKWS